MRQIFIKLAGISLIAMLMPGCATLGPSYQKVDKIPDGMGLVYIYRQNSFIGGGVYYDVKTGTTVITTLHSGGYYPYFAKPGELELWAKTEARTSVTLDVKAGETYYVKGTVGVGFVVGHPHLTIVSKDVGEAEIVECKLEPPAEGTEKK
ncbi:MAG TPA: hypothetical protein VEG25_04205 [Burkholderiales bacterium]|nr:hypothetical protein [Burkholderiales bacterium]